MQESPFKEEKSIKSSLDTRVSMFPAPVLAHERIYTLEKIL